MGRTPGHPWVGEAVALDFALPVAGAAFADEGEAMRYEDGATTTLAAGESFLAGFFDSEMLLTGDVAVFTFAVVCAAGSSGTIRLSGGVDPDFALTDPGDASQSLGTYTVTGAGVTASSALTRDVDDYLAQTSETVVYVECLSGSVIIEQVKLRVWPVGGPVGGWALAPAFTVAVAPEAWRVVTVMEASSPVTLTGYGSSSAAWDAAAAALQGIWSAGRAVDASMVPVVGAEMPGVVDVALNSGPDAPALSFLYDGSAEGLVGGSIAQQANPEFIARLETPRAVDIGTYGVDVVAGPDTVPGDLRVELPTAPSVAWGDAVIPSGVGGYSPDNNRATAYYEIVPVADEATDDPTTLTFPLDAANALPGAPFGADQPVTMPDSRTVLLVMSTDVLTDPPAYLDEGGEFSNARAVLTFKITLADSTVTVPAYRYWSPAGGIHPLRLLQRGDSLGMGSGRVLGAGTRQGSVKVFGSL